VVLHISAALTTSGPKHRMTILQQATVKSHSPTATAKQQHPTPPDQTNSALTSQSGGEWHHVAGGITRACICWWLECNAQQLYALLHRCALASRLSTAGCCTEALTAFQPVITYPPPTHNFFGLILFCDGGDFGFYIWRRPGAMTCLGSL